MSPCTLTQRQADVLDYIREYTDRQGYPPSFRELADDCKLGSPSGAHRMILTLERKGFIKRDAGLSRGLSLTPAQVDFSTMDMGDLVRFRTMAEQHAVCRDITLMVAAEHADESTKEGLITESLERTRRVIEVTRVLDGLLPGIDVQQRVRPLRHALELAKQDWTRFVLDEYTVNRLSVAVCEAVADRSPQMRAVVWPDVLLFRASAERAACWLRDLIEDGSALPDHGDLPRADTLMNAMHEMTSGIDDEFDQGMMSVTFSGERINEVLTMPTQLQPA
jgi:hypothetical protein